MSRFVVIPIGKGRTRKDDSKIIKFGDWAMIRQEHLCFGNGGVKRFKIEVCVMT